MHPTGAEGNLYDGPRVAGGLPDTYPERHGLLLQPGQSILTSMIFGGVFVRFPDLKLVLSEYGVTWALPMMWRMDRAWELGDRELAGLSVAPSETVRRNVRFTTQPLDEPPVQQQLWDILGADARGGDGDVQLRLPALGPGRPANDHGLAAAPSTCAGAIASDDGDGLLRQPPRPVSEAGL